MGRGRSGGGVLPLTMPVAAREAVGKQSRTMSFIEAVANVVVGYGLAVGTQILVFPWFGLPAHLDDALAIGGIFTLVSIARSFCVRRLFEGIRCARAR